MLTPILKKLTEDGSSTLTGSGAAIDLITVDTDAQTDLAKEFSVSYPIP